MNAFQQTLAGLIFILTGFGFTPKGSADEGFFTDPSKLSPALQKVWQATVKIERRAALHGSVQTIISGGSGVIIAKVGKGFLIATNAHVATCPLGYVCTLRVSGGGLNTLASVVSSRMEWDAALIATGEASGISPAPLHINPLGLLPPLSSVFGVGYPDLSLRSKKAWSTPRPSDYSSRIKRWSAGDYLSAYPSLKKNDYPIIEGSVTGKVALPMSIRHTADNIKGSSGGPIADDNGYVIGLMTATVGENKGYAHCGVSGSGCSYIAIPSTAFRQMAIAKGYSLPN